MEAAGRRDNVDHRQWHNLLRYSGSFRRPMAARADRRKHSAALGRATGAVLVRTAGSAGTVPAPGVSGLSVGVRTGPRLLWFPRPRPRLQGGAAPRGTGDLSEPSAPGRG